MTFLSPFPIIAIDGPAGAGKSTVAKEVARRLDFLFLDTGALYRTVALFLSQRQVALDNSEAVEFALSQLNLRLDPNGKVFLGNEEVSQAIRTPEINQLVSKVASIPAVRATLLGTQQAFGRGEGFSSAPKGLVAEGRDIGTVVFPDSKQKFFLVASLETRAKRRQKEFIRDGRSLSVHEVMGEIARRDEQDANRALAPLRKAVDAKEIDTTALSIEEAVTKILNEIGPIQP